MYETDDDNFAESLDVFIMGEPRKFLLPNAKNLTHNPAQHFGQISMWPRGFPLDHLGIEPVRDYTLCTTRVPTIQQGLVYADPDLDAMFRMIHNIHSGITELDFDPNAPVIVYPENVYTPFNSQNTFYHYRAFWALFLFKTVTDREMDIYRSYWAQRMMWMTSDRLAYLPPATIQKRNMWHKNIEDVRYETRLYSSMSKFIAHLNTFSCSEAFFFDCLTNSVRSLYDAGFIEYEDIAFMQAWVHDLASVGYAPPTLHKQKSSCTLDDAINVVYYPVEQKVKVNYLKEHIIPQDSDCRENIQKTVTDVCGYESGANVLHRMETTEKVKHILLVVAVKSFDVIPALNAYYRPHFPLILYCGSQRISKTDWEKLRVTYVNVGKRVDATTCVGVAMDMNYKVDGYLFTTQNTMVSFESVKQATHRRGDVWLNKAGIVLPSDSTVQDLCKNSQISCSTPNSAQLDNAVVQAMLKAATSDSLKNNINTCSKNVNDFLTSRGQNARMTTDYILYIPNTDRDTFEILRKVFSDLEASLSDKTFLVPLLMECLHGGDAVHLDTSTPPLTPSTSLSLNQKTSNLFPFLFKDIYKQSLYAGVKLFCTLIAT